jgi:cytochrome c-type biogenesis protein
MNAGRRVQGVDDLMLSLSEAMQGSALVALGAAFLWGVTSVILTFAFLAPVLGVTFGSAAVSPLYGAALLLAFGVGHCGVIGLAGTSAGFVQRALDCSERSKGLQILRVTCGVLLLTSASVLIYTA